MKQRLISSAVGLVVLVIAVIFYDTLLINCFAAFITGVAVLELFNAAKLTKYKLFSAVSVAFGAFLMFVNAGNMMEYLIICSTGYMVFCFSYLLYKHSVIDVKEICYGVLMTLLISLSFFTLVCIRDRSNAQLGVFYLLIIFGSAWWSDSGAYFAGTYLGKHKLCPTISPKKTVEGLVGGIATAVIGNLLVAQAFAAVSSMLVPFGYFTAHMNINILAIVLVTPFLSLIGVLGDLSASIIKRQNDIKDFGHIMPGHGGIMDRFDSVLFISPLVFMVMKFHPLAVLC